MREILFRGKEVDLQHGKIVIGEWVEGFYYNQDSLLYIKDKYVACPYILVYDEDYGGTPSLGNMGSPRFYRVLPETIGQYIGLTDKNGKKIFEGDIVKFGDTTGIINYSTGCYCIKTNKPDWASRNNPAIDIILNEYPNEVEIIGNTHDNPELLEDSHK